MVPNWFVRKDDRELGPFPAVELKQMAKSGQLRTTDLVRKEDTEKWLPASALKGLFTPTDAPPLVQPAKANTSAVRSQGGGKRLALIGTALVAFLALLSAGWFFMQSQHYQSQLDKAEEKLRLVSIQNVQPSKDGDVPAKTASPIKQGGAGEQEAQLRAQVQKLKDKSDKDALALDESRKSGAQLQAKSQQDALALSGLQTSLREFQAETGKRLEQQVKQRIAELDKKALLQEETLTALRKNLGLGEADQASHELIDKYALAAPPEVEQSLDSLARYLAAPFRTDKEKVRAIYRWIADRISYDVPVLFTKDGSKQGAGEVLASRKAVCMGYANLFERLCQLNDVEVVLINGDAGGSAEFPGTLRHSWNAVKIEGKWQLIDVTWGAGNIKNKAFEKKLNEAYFLAPPEMMVLGHLPDASQWQLLEPTLSEPDVRVLFTLPRPALMKMLETGANGNALLQQAVKNESFRANLQKVSNSQVFTLQKLGLLSGDTLLETLSKEKFAGLVTAGFPPGLEALQVRKAPLSKELLAGTTLHVELSGVGQAAIIMNGKFFPMTSKGTHFTGSVVLQPGEVKIGVLSAGKSNVFHNILVYSVVESGGK